jgi:hypothetical protein
MTHFAPEAWADFARRNLTAAEEMRMQEHLESGCRACVETLQIWLGVLEVATGLNVHNPPDRGLRFVKALYRAFPPSQLNRGRVDVARLVIPSGITFADGLRASARQRHFVFQRGNVLLDVQIDLDPHTGAISLAGQLMDPIAPSGRFGAKRVTLLSEDAELAQAETNAFGEFHLEFAAATDLVLVIQLEPESMLVTPLPSFVLGPTMSGSGMELLKENDDAAN